MKHWWEGVCSGVGSEVGWGLTLTALPRKATLFSLRIHYLNHLAITEYFHLVIYLQPQIPELENPSSTRISIITDNDKVGEHTFKPFRRGSLYLAVLDAHPFLERQRRLYLKSTR